MQENINLIPESEKQEQVKVKAIKVSTILSVLLLVASGLISGWFYYRAYNIKNELTALDSNIDSLRTSIKNQSPMEIVARNLYTKFVALQNIYSTGFKYSGLISELHKRKTDGIVIDSFSLGMNSVVNLSGTGDNYILVAKLMRDLTDPAFPGATPGLEKLFKSVSLTSVSLSNSQNRATYVMSVSYDPALLVRK